MEDMLTYAWDLECTNLRADIGKLTVACFAEIKSDGSMGEVICRDINQMHGEKNLAKWTRNKINEADSLIGHNSDAFDKNFLNGVLIRNGLPKAPRRQHIDTLQVARYGLKGQLQSYSLENLLDYFRIPIKKDKPSKHDWREANILDNKSLQRIRKRCQEDVKGQALLWDKMKPYWHEWKGK